jgi:hypothetical protein
MIVRHVIQHTPVVPNDSVHRDHSHNLVTELAEKFPLQGFGEAVCDDLFGRAVLNCNFLSGNAVCDKEMPNVDISWPCFASSRSRMVVTTLGSTRDIFKSSTCQTTVHCLPLMVDAEITDSARIAGLLGGCHAGPSRG